MQGQPLSSYGCSDLRLELLASRLVLLYTANGLENLVSGSIQAEGRSPMQLMHPHVAGLAKSNWIGIRLMRKGFMGPVMKLDRIHTTARLTAPPKTVKMRIATLCPLR